MKKPEIEKPRAVVPMFARYLEGPKLSEVTGGREHVLLGGGSGLPPPNSSTHNGDFDY